MRTLYALFLLLLTSVSADAQTLTVRGTIADDTGAAGIGIQHASIALIRAKDSMLTGYTRSKSDGSFTLTADSPGRYILLATHLGSADFLETFSLTTDSPVHETGTVPMLARERLIQEVLVRGRSAITIKGDTVEYAADSFAVREGATVEELLRKLPGLQVDRAGKITAQGEQVQKILVDGEEFFSDDPAVVTQNLQAKAVDAVQIYDKKSDQAELTGIDDGERQKTINLKLKDAYKRGYFGKAQAAVGPNGASGSGMRNGYYENQLMANAFRAKRQISVFGISANTGRAGLGWEDRGKYTGGGDNAVADEETGELYTTWWDRSGEDNSTDYQGNFSGEGLPRALTGGVHYADKWGANDGQHLSGNYRASKILSENEARTITQHILPDSTYTRTQDRSAFSDARRHQGDALYEWKIDTAKSIRLTADAGWSNTISNTRTATRSFAEDGEEVNRSDRGLFSDATSKTQNASLTWRQKFQKKGRSLSINLRESWRESTTDSRLDVTNIFFTASGSAGGFVDTVAQQKDYNTRSLTLKGGASYTEPLSKTVFAEARYDLDLTDARSRRLSYDRGPGSESYDVLARAFSSDYDYHASTHTGGLGLRYVTKKVTVSGGSGVGLTRFDQDDLFLDTSIHRDYVNYFPRASFVWRIGRQRTLRLGYNGRTEQPSIEQIQPLRENTDPLNVVLGNPDLKQQFHHQINGNYNDYKVLTGAYTYAGFWGNITQDKFAQATNTDELGRRTAQWINMDGGYNFWAWAGYGRKIKPIDLQASVNINPGFTRTVTFVNGVRGLTTNNTYSVGLNLDRSWKKGSSDTDRAGISLHPEFTYKDNKSTISSLVTSYYQIEISGDAWVELPFNFRISTSAWINLRQRTEVFPTNNNVIRWDAYLARKFLKDRTLEARIAVFDILNQNIGFQRNTTSTSVTENRYLTVQRYGLLSLVWNFTKSSGGASGNDAMMMIGG